MGGESFPPVVSAVFFARRNRGGGGSCGRRERTLVSAAGRTAAGPCAGISDPPPSRESRAYFAHGRSGSAAGSAPALGSGDFRDCRAFSGGTGGETEVFPALAAASRTFPVSGRVLRRGGVFRRLPAATWRRAPQEFPSRSGGAVPGNIRASVPAGGRDSPSQRLSNGRQEAPNDRRG